MPVKWLGEPEDHVVGIVAAIVTMAFNVPLNNHLDFRDLWAPRYC